MLKSFAVSYEHKNSNNDWTKQTEVYIDGIEYNDRVDDLLDLELKGRVRNLYYYSGDLLEQKSECDKNG